MQSINAILSFIFGLLFNLTFAQNSDDQQLLDYFDKMLTKQFKIDEPGGTVLVSRGGEIIYKNAFGMANLELNATMHVDNVFWIASIGKQFTAVAILQLMEQGKLNLQDEITKYIPDYPTHGNGITIEHLLTHTSGIHNFSGMKDPDKRLAYDCAPTEVIDFFKNLPMRFAPGTKWEYSNSGYFLLGYIIELITGKPYSEYLDEKFFKPLDMNNSFFASNKKIIKNRVGAYSYGDNGFENSRPLNMTHIYSAGAIQSTVKDFYIWHQAIHSYKLLKKETLDKAFTRYKLSNGTETDYGYGWRLGYVYESPSIWHGGSIEGFGTNIIYLPKEDVFVAVFANCDCIYPKEIAFKLAALTAGKPFGYQEISINNSILEEYTGLYENLKAQQWIISISENQLYSQLGRGPKSKLIPYQKDKFYFKDDVMKTIEFTRDKSERIETLITMKLDGNVVWTKTNKPLPNENGIKVEDLILATYVGEYEIPSIMTFSIFMEQNKLFLQAEGQDKIEIFADTENTFFTKVNDAELEFVKDNFGKVKNIVLNQSGREVVANKIK